MKSLEVNQLEIVSGGLSNAEAQMKIIGCTLGAAAAGYAALASVGLLAFVGIAALTQAGCVATSLL